MSHKDRSLVKGLCSTHIRRQKMKKWGTMAHRATLSFAGEDVISKYTHCLVQKHACTASIRGGLHALVLGTSRATGVSLVLHVFWRLELMPFTQQSEQLTDVIYSTVVCTMIRLRHVPLHGHNKFSATFHGNRHWGWCIVFIHCSNNDKTSYSMITVAKIRHCFYICEHEEDETSNDYELW